MENSVLNKTISKLNTYSDQRPKDINLIEYLLDFSLKNEVKKIRSLTNEDEQKKLKALLPAIMISGKFNTRGEQGLVEHSGLISFDIDHVPNMELYYQKIISIPYTAYCSLSARGKGYFGIFAISNKAKHKEHFAAMQLYFQQLGIHIDTAPSNVSSLRGYSFDTNAYFNHRPQIFNLLYEVPVSKKVYNPSVIDVAENPFDHFNKSGDIESLLIAHGWTYQHTKGTRVRYARPGKQSGISADYCRERKILYLFSDDPSTKLIRPQAGYNNVSVYCQLECDNDWKLCGKKLKLLGYGNTSASLNNINRLQA